MAKVFNLAYMSVPRGRPLLTGVLHLVWPSPEIDTALQGDKRMEMRSVSLFKAPCMPRNALTFAASNDATTVMCVVDG
jgi:hypothetical protein